MSIVIDHPTVKDLSQLIQGQDGVAIYRIGHINDTVSWSKRRGLHDALVFYR